MAVSALAKWISSVRSVAVPPVLRLAVPLRSTSPGFGNGLQGQGVRLQQLQRGLVNLDLGQHLLVADATAADPG